MLAAVAAVAAGCGERTAKQNEQEAQTPAADVKTDREQWNGYTKIEPQEIEGNVIQTIGEEWMLVTSGDSADYNTMTASWGGAGVVWSRPVAWITIRNTRYTHEFLTANDIYTLTFFGGGQKEAMMHLGSVSGRDGDKVAQSGLTPMETPLGSVSFEEATMIVECRKIFQQALDPKSIFVDEIAAEYISSGDRHDLFFGEIVNVWIK